MIAAADCICRKEATMFGKRCGKLMECCMMFDMAADYYIENEFGREISKEEAKRILLKAEEDRLVHHSSNRSGQKIFTCNCCGCCCKALASITKHHHPDAIAKSNYYAVVDEEECSGCETCVERCQVNAIRVEDDIAVIDKDVCIGCGLCVSSCPTESILMSRKSPDKASPVFADNSDLLTALAKEKNKPFPFE